MSDLKIPPSLQPSDKPKHGDLSVRKFRNGFVIQKYTNGEWWMEDKDQRIVAAMCRCAWLDEADRRWRQGNGEGVRPELAAEQAEAWRRYGEGER